MYFSHIGPSLYFSHIGPILSSLTGAVPSSLLPPMESETVILGLGVPPVRLSPDEEQGWWWCCRSGANQCRLPLMPLYSPPWGLRPTMGPTGAGSWTTIRTTVNPLGSQCRSKEACKFRSSRWGGWQIWFISTRVFKVFIWQVLWIDLIIVLI